MTATPAVGAPAHASGRRRWLQLLQNMVGRELRSQFKNSFLGWTWSMINPMTTILVYALVFTLIFRSDPTEGSPSGLRSYPLFLACGIIPWQFHASCLTQATGSVWANRALVGKIYFPRTVIPTATAIARSVTYLIEMGVLLVALLIIGGNNAFMHVPVLIAVMAIQTLFVLGIALATSALDVYFRDMGYLISIALQPWFWLTPIIYPVSRIPDREILGLSIRTLYGANPMMHFITIYRDLLYHLRLPPVGDLITVAAFATASLAVGTLVFLRLEPRFVEEF